MITVPVKAVSSNQAGVLKAGNTQSNNLNFGDILKESLNKIDSDINGASTTFNTLIAGNADDYHQFLIDTEKTAMTLQLTLQIRNKAIDAYNEIMRMQL